MANFKTPRTGGNVVHRIELPTAGRRQRSRRRALEQRAPETRVVIERVSAPAPAPPPPPAPVARIEPAPRPASLEDSQARHQIELLERRLAKMARLLEDRDGEVVLQPVVEDGVSSIYREVQGLKGRGKEVKQKKALMSAIFEANRDLRERLVGS